MHFHNAYEDPDHFALLTGSLDSNPLSIVEKMFAIESSAETKYYWRALRWHFDQ